MLQDQRKSVRKVWRTKIAVAIDGQQPVLGKTIDVGANGVGVCLAEPLPAGHSGQLGFDLLIDGKFTPVLARARVTHCIFSNNEFKVGFHFLNLDPAGVAALNRFMR